MSHGDACDGIMSTENEVSNSLSSQSEHDCEKSHRHAKKSRGKSHVISRSRLKTQERHRRRKRDSSSLSSSSSSDSSDEKRRRSKSQSKSRKKRKSSHHGHRSKGCSPINSDAERQISSIPKQSHQSASTSAAIIEDVNQPQGMNIMSQFRKLYFHCLKFKKIPRGVPG